MLIYRYLLIFVGHNWLGRQWPWSFLDIWWWCSAIIFKETWPESYCTCTSGDIFMYFYSHIPRTWSSFAFVFFLFVAFHILGFFSQGGNSWFWHEIYPLKNRPGSQRKIADIEFVYFIPFWFFSQVVEDGYRFFEKRKVCQSFGLWRHCELNSLITSLLNKNIYRPATHVIFTSHKSRRHVHAQSPNQPNVSTDKSLQQKTNGWGHNSISFIDHYRIYWNSVFFFSLHFYRLFLSNLIRTDTEGEDRNDICFQWRV